MKKFFYNLKNSFAVIYYVYFAIVTSSKFISLVNNLSSEYIQLSIKIKFLLEFLLIELFLIILLVALLKENRKLIVAGFSVLFINCLYNAYLNAFGHLAYFFDNIALYTIYYIVMFLIGVAYAGYAVIVFYNYIKGSNELIETGNVLLICLLILQIIQLFLYVIICSKYHWNITGILDVVASALLTLLIGVGVANYSKGYNE